MRHFQIFFAVLTALLLGGCAHNAEYVQQRYVAMWNQRAAEYALQMSQYKLALSARTKEFHAIAVRHDASADDLKNARVSAISALSDFSKLQGRKLILTQFNQFRSTHPPLGMMDAWFSDKAGQLKSALTNTTRGWQTWRAKVADRSTVYYDWWKDLVGLVSKQGLVDGAANELIRVHREMVGYVSDYARAEQADELQRQRFAAAMQQLGNNLQQQAYQQQMLYQMSRPRTCTTIGYSVTCY